jgi:hypothetical protein
MFIVDPSLLIISARCTLGGDKNGKTGIGQYSGTFCLFFGISLGTLVDRLSSLVKNASAL